jgi:hypothetical protein
MAAIAIWERMNEYQPVMKSDSNVCDAGTEPLNASDWDNGSY